MKINKFFIVGILLLAILAIAAVGASEDISDDVVAVEPSDELISDQIDDCLETEPQDEILEETPSPDNVLEDDDEVLNFTNLENTIENSDSTEINLTNNYKYSEEDLNRTYITIERTVVLDGKGHTLDGDGAELDLYIYGKDVTIKNLIFKNFKQEDSTPYTYIYFVEGASGGRIENCTFENISRPRDNTGTLMRILAGNVTVSGCTFKDVDMRRFMEITNDDVVIDNCNFTNNNLSYSLISAAGDPHRNVQITNCNFDSNYAEYYLLHLHGNNSKIENCTFKNNTGGYYGYVTTQTGNNSIMHNCSFENNTALDAYGAMQYPISSFGQITSDGASGDNISVTNVTFKDNIGVPILWNANSGNVTGCIFQNNNGSISNRGNVYRDNGQYDFDVLVFNNTVIGYPNNGGSGGMIIDPGSGGSGGMIIGPSSGSIIFPGFQSKDTLANITYYGNVAQSGNIVVLLNGIECYNKAMEDNFASIKLENLTDIPKAGEVPIVIKFTNSELDWVLYEGTAFIDYYLRIIAYGYMPVLYPHGTLDFNITLPKDATGTLILDDGIKNHTVKYADGSAICTLYGTDYKGEGDRSVSLSLVDDPKYQNKTIKSGFELYYKVDVPQYVSEGEIDYILLDFLDDFVGNVIVYNTTEGQITGILLNESFKGMAQIPLPAFVEGNYSFVVEIPGKYNYTENMQCFKNQEGINSSIDSNIITLGGDAVLTVNCQVSNCSLYLAIDQSVPMNVMPIDLNDTTYVHSISNLTAGVHKIKIFIIKNDGTGSGIPIVYSANYLITVKDKEPTPTPTPKVPAKIVAKNYAPYYNKGTYTVTVYGTDGKVAKGVSVVFKINGKKVKTVKTNAKGVAKFKIPAKYVPKKYKISATALGKTVTKRLTVKQVLKLKKVSVKRSAKKLVLTATLKEGKKAIKGKKITFRFKGKKYVKKTNKKGIAKVTIKKKVLKKLKKGKKVTYKATYLKDTVKRTVKVKK